MSFIERLTELLKQHNLTSKQFLNEMHFGKNQFTYWKKNQTIPNQSTLAAIANYFNVPVEFLTGESDYKFLIPLATKNVIKWLEDNSYRYEEKKDHTILISKDGNCLRFTLNDFEAESKAINENAKNGFQLAMVDWVTRNFCTKEPHLLDQEKTLLKLFRETTEEGRFEMIAAIMQIKKSIEKKHTDSNSEAIG